VIDKINRNLQQKQQTKMTYFHEDLLRITVRIDRTRCKSWVLTLGASPNPLCSVPQPTTTNKQTKQYLTFTAHSLKPVA